MANGNDAGRFSFFFNVLSYRLNKKETWPGRVRYLGLTLCNQERRGVAALAPSRQTLAAKRWEQKSPASSVPGRETCAVPRSRSRTGLLTVCYSGPKCLVLRTTAEITSSGYLWLPALPSCQHVA